MKKLFFLLLSFILTVGAAVAQKPQSIVVADWEKSPGALNSSPGDKINYTRNAFPEGINTSKGIGTYTHRNNEWSTAEIQAGRLRRDAGIEPAMPEDIHLGYYDSFEFKEYFPATTEVAGLASGLAVELRSDGPDRGTDANVQRENWERQYATYPGLPLNDAGGSLVDTWFKVERSGIVSGRTLGMIQVKFRPGQAAPSNQSTIYLDDFIFHLKKSNKICTYRETFYIQKETDAAWQGDPNQDITLYAGNSWEVKLQKGKDRWVGGAELQSSFVDFQYEAGTSRDYYLRMNAESPAILIENIAILPDLVDLQFQVDIRSREPLIEYRLDGGNWAAIDFNTSGTAVGPTWNTFTFNISAAHASKVDLRISAPGITGDTFIDNLTFWGTDPNMVSAIPGVADAPQVRIYPNPVESTLYIAGEVKKADLYDMQGKAVLSGAGKTIDVSGLNAGMYIVKLHTDKGVFSSKVFKK
ncbi:MAG: T9SS type A sorting domain-containing protein [Dysgonamonadaceae bacterium]|jgi:hypothetical protein|nr:T9SS type A sorting domain-containing protein [Dysgonamonadaceae bacterium]